MLCFLILIFFQARDTGTYQCIAANPVGEDLGELKLIVESKLAFDWHKWKMLNNFIWINLANFEVKSRLDDK